MKVLLFGAGENARRFLRHHPAARRLEITAVADNDSARWGEVFEEKYKVVSPKEALEREWDLIAVTPAAYFEMEEQLVSEFGVEKEKIVRASDFLVPALANLGSVRLECDYEGCYVVSGLIPDRVIPGNGLEEFYFKREHRVMNKWWHYFEVYHTFFQKYVGSAVKILEIGVYKGGSMQMWKDYFGEQATIVGMDIDRNCKQYEDGNIHICIGSQADREFLEDVSEKWGPFDIVLDDGSHDVKHQIITFETLFPLLKEGGVYVCEDCQSSYSARYNGGYRKPDTFMEYSKNFADCVNSQYVDLGREKELPAYAEDIKACHYYDSMVVLEKKRRGYSFFTEYGRR